MNRVPVPDSLLEYLQRYKTYYLMGHLDPDGDCLGSALALSLYLQRKGKATRLFNQGPFDRSEILSLKPVFQPRIDPELPTTDPEPAVIVLDCSTPERLGSLQEDIRGLPTATIDHHVTTGTFWDVTYIDPTAPSTSFLVERIIRACNDNPTREEAEHILFALATDTGFFRHLDETSADVFEMTSRGVSTGVSPREIHTRMFGGKPLESRLLLGKLLGRTESYFDGKVLLTWDIVTKTDAEYAQPTFGPSTRPALSSQPAPPQEAPESDRDTAMLYQLLLTVSGCEAVVFLRYEDTTGCTGSLRSLDTVNVAAVAEFFGGGGHKRAAGFTVNDDLEAVREKVLSLLRDQIEALQL
jgi:bifunctional oligoribonuclease and PAP phosphatase NrnA